MFEILTEIAIRDEWISFPLAPKGAHWAMAGDELDIVAERPELFRY